MTDINVFCLSILIIVIFYFNEVNTLEYNSNNKNQRNNINDKEDKKINYHIDQQNLENLHHNKGINKIITLKNSLIFSLLNSSRKTNVLHSSIKHC